MDPLTIAAMFGYSAGLLTATFTWPQVLRLHREGTASGVAPGTYQCLVVSASLWFGYGLSIHSGPQVVANFIQLLSAAAVLTLLVRLEATRTRMNLLAGGAGVLIGTLAITCGGVHALGWAAVAASFSMRFPQLFRVARGGEARGLSRATWLVSGGGSLLWIGYGILRGDGPVLASATTSILIATSIVVLARRSRSAAGEFAVTGEPAAA